MPSLTMSRAEREAFLAATHVGIVSIAEPGRGPLTVPVWYRYERGGAVRFVTGAQLAQGRAHPRRPAASASACRPRRHRTSTSASRGRRRSASPTTSATSAKWRIRYLGKQMGEMYLAMMAAEPEPAALLVIMQPERWYSVDYSKLG